MDEKLREFVSVHFKGHPQRLAYFERLYYRAKEITALLDGPSYLTKTDIATLVTICESWMAFSPIDAEPPSREEVQTELSKGDMITYKIDGKEMSGEFIGKGPGGRYKVMTDDGPTLLAKELVSV
jgi:hypothetical protein